MGGMGRNDRDARTQPFPFSSRTGAAPEDPERVHGRGQAALLDFVESLPPETGGCLLALFVDPKLDVLAADNIGRGGLAAVPVSLDWIVSRGRGLDAAGFFLVHNEPETGTDVTRAHLAAAARLAEWSLEFDMPLIDCCIVSDGGIRSMLQSRALRRPPDR